MKIHLVSDTHNEMTKHSLSGLEADVIILCGDIDNGMRGIEWAAKYSANTKAHIIYVAGNHEFYNQDLPALRRVMKSYCGPPTGWEGDDSENRLHFLDDDEIVIGGVRFLGCTLWTDFKLFGSDPEDIQSAMTHGERHLNDYNKIRFNGRYFRAEDSLNLHEASVRFLQQKLKHETFDGPTVVVTHHLPSAQSIPAEYKNSISSACFASNLDEQLMGYSDLWLHGHTHDSFNYNIKGTQIISNPRGYTDEKYPNKQENPDFNKNLIIEIDAPEVNLKRRNVPK